MNRRLTAERNKLLRSMEKVLDGPMITLGFVWLVLIVVELVWSLPIWLEYVSLAIWVLFILDFILKFFLAPVKGHYLRTNWLTAISLVIPAIRVFRLLRIFRLMRGVRVVKVIASLNRSMKSLAAAMDRRGVTYVILLVLLFTFGGAAGMYAVEKANPGFESYGMALWWTSMRVITAGSDFWPLTPEGRVLAFILSLFGYAVFGYVTATLATFFIGRDAEENGTPVAGSHDIDDLKKMITVLSGKIDELKNT